MLNRLTPLYFRIYYKKENYLKVKTTVFKYITPPYSKRFSILVYYIPIVHTNLMIQVSHIQGHEIRLVLYARLDGGDYRFY